MAISACRECGKDVSDRAQSCPHCGAPMTSFGSWFNKTAGNVLTIFGILVVLFLAALFLLK